MANKSEKPTRKRLRDARKRGEVLHSREVTSAVGFMVLVTTTVITLPWLWKRLQRLFELTWSADVMNQPAESWHRILALIVPELGALAIPMALIGASAATLAGIVQVRGVFSADPVLPKLMRINPIEGFKRIFSTYNLFNLCKLMVKLVLMSTAISWVIVSSTNSILRLMYGKPIEAADAGAHLVFMLFAATGALFITFAVLDYIHQYYEYMKKMRMSKDEVQREHRDIDGNPYVKNARRRLARELAFSALGDATRKATVLVVNPTHFAVALAYEAGVTDLPVVVEKATDNQALFLRGVAREAGVPVFEYPLLARELFANTAVSSYIPRELFPAVAEVLRWVRDFRPESGES